MAKAADRSLLFAICLFAIVVLGAVQSGAGPAISGWAYGAGHTQTITDSQTTHRTHTTTHRTTTTHRSTSSTSGGTSTTGTGSETSTTSEATVPSFNLGGVILPLDTLAWYMLIFAVLVLGSITARALVGLQKPRVFDLKGMVREMRAQQRYFSGTWSEKLRNAALLRYYVLMTQACAKIGIMDQPADTPHEFVSRASSELEVEGADSLRFADAVDRAHYGAELSTDEVTRASGFMESFTNGILRRTGIG